MNFLKRLIYRITHGWNSLYPPLTAEDVQDGKVPDIWRVWLAELQHDIGVKMTVYYAQPYNYTDSFESLVTQVRIADTISGNAAARGSTQRLIGGATVLNLTTRSMNDRLYVQHELLHLMQYKHAELFGPTAMVGQFPGDHWPLIFDAYGSH